MARMFNIPYMEMLITNSCNLSCDGCANFSNYNLGETLNFNDYREMMRLWPKRVTPKVFQILGGEPLIHPDLPKFVEFAAELWPDARRAVVTNGLLAGKRNAIAPVLARTKTELHVSFHSSDPKYIAMLAPNLKIIKQWVKDFEIVATISDYTKFNRRLRGLGKHLQPFNDGDTRSSFNNCIAKQCKTLYKGRIWKCPPIAYLPVALTKFGIENNPEWRPYVSYQGIGLDASDAELLDFLNRGPEDVCGMCPAQPHNYDKDVFNRNFDRNEEYIEADFPKVDLVELVHNS